MAKCISCGNRIVYNKYKIIDSKVYCLDCANKLVEAKVAKIIEPTEEAKEELLKQGIKLLEAPKKCPKCNGTGKLQYDDGDRYLDDICDKCNGTGQVE